MSERDSEKDLTDEESTEESEQPIENEEENLETEELGVEDSLDRDLSEEEDFEDDNEDEEIAFDDEEEEFEDDDLESDAIEGEGEEGEFEDDDLDSDAIEGEGEEEAGENAIETKKPLTEDEVRQFSKNLIEGALYASGSPLDIEELSTKLELPKKITEELVNELAFEYLERNSSLVIAQVGEKWQMQLKPEYTEAVSKFAKGGGIAERYLRTLTVIALKQPILKSLLIKLRGSGAYEHVKYLLDNDLISATKKGRSQELTTTDKYSEMFGLPKEMAELKRVMIKQLGVEPEIKRDD